MADSAGVTVRQATREDAGTVVEFMLAMARETEGRELDAERLRRGVRGIFERPGRGTYFVAEFGGQVVGSLLITFEWSDWRDGDFWWIQSVYVRPDARRRGVYAALHRHVEAAARATGGCGLRLYVDKHNEKARNAYLRMGLSASHYDMYENDFVLPAPK